MFKNFVLEKTGKIKDAFSSSIAGLNVGEKAFLANSFNEQFIYVCPDILLAKNLQAQLLAMGKKGIVLEDKLSLVSGIANGEYQKYSMALAGFVQKKFDYLIVMPAVLLQVLPNASFFKSNSLEIKTGKIFNQTDFIKKLVLLGYKNSSFVASEGQFSHRGDIVDIFVCGSSYPTRIHFFDDEIEKINTFDPSSFFTVEERKSVLINPNTLFIVDENQKEQIVLKIKNAFSAKKLEPASAIRLAEVMEYNIELLREGVNNSSFVLPFCDYFNTNILSFCKTVFYDEPKLILDMLEVEVKDFLESYERLLTGGEILSTSKNFYNLHPFEAKNNQNIAFTRLVSTNKIFKPLEYFTFTTISPQRYTHNLGLLNIDLQKYLHDDFKVLLCAGDAYTKNKILSFLDSTVFEKFFKAEALRISEKFLPYSIGFENEKILIIGTKELSNKVFDEKAPSEDILKKLPKVSDFVVHQTHGIGKCIGIEKLKITSSFKDYIILQYQGGDVLYVPSENLEVLSVYSGLDNPKLNKIGGVDFYKTKEKAKQSMREMAFDLLNVYSKKQKAKAFKYEKNEFLLDEFQKSFEFEYTTDQVMAVKDINKDMESDRIIDRLICGDVGFGKTEVALYAAYKAVLSGKQVAFIAPTTILSQQHFNTALSRLKDFVVNVEVINRLKSPSEQKATLGRLKEGKIDLIIGTHRLLSKDVVFKDLGLLILDEEQRFGVEDKEKLRNLKADIDVISLSATPIPRTLYMSLVGIRDISYLQTPPKERVPIKTTVIDYSDTLLVDACKKEVDRGGQVLIVYNRVETIYDFAKKVRALLPEAVVGVAHGQMAPKALEDAIFKVYTKQTQILIATVLIENGVDLPSANTMIVINSDFLGLSQLYQLRGRIGRSNIASYAYLTFARNKALTQEAYKRLDALMEYNTFGSGLKVAVQDLQIRGAGNVLGREQHGHMQKIGYDLYFKLLDEVVKEMRGESVAEQREVKIDVSLNAYLPEEYIESEENRIVYYTKISAINNRADIDLVLSQLKDAYGDVPKEAIELCQIALIKNLAKKLLIQRIKINSSTCEIVFYKDKEILNTPLYDYVISQKNIGIKFKPEPKLTFAVEENVLKSQDNLINFLLEVQKL